MNLSYLPVNHISSFVLRVQTDTILFRETTAVIGWLLVNMAINVGCPYNLDSKLSI